MESIKKLLNEQVTIAFRDYGLVIACIFIGFVLGFAFKSFVVDRRTNQLIKARFDDKDEQINDLKQLVYERLSGTSEQIDPGIFKRLKKFFKRTVKGVKINRQRS